MKNTIQGLYDHRNTLFVAILNHYPGGFNIRKIWKSKVDGEGQTEEGWFLAGIVFWNDEQISYHLPMDLWDKVKVQELPKAPDFDGHTSEAVLERIKKHMW